ncbi:MAG: hypothetical protein HYY18_22885 [Planctomycetes bacterium]|nr:hypothetical protein [Planctomycetota bacterium]
MNRFLALLLLLPALAPADVVKTKDGRVLEGRIVEETAEKVVIEVERKGGKAKMAVPLANVASIERGPAPREQYESRAAKLAAADWPAELELAKFCQEKGLVAEAGKHFAHIVSESAGATQTIEARAALLKMGWRAFPGEGWKPEDAYWTPKGFVKRGGKWVTADFAEAYAAVEKAEKTLRDFRKKGDYLAGLGEYAKEYRRCIDGLNDLQERQGKLAVEVEEKRLEVLADLTRITVIDLRVEDIDQLAFTQAGDLITSRGEIVIVKARQDTAEWRIYEGHRSELESLHAEDRRNREEMSALTERTKEILDKAKSEGKVLVSAEGEEKRLEEVVREAEARREEKRAAMLEKLDENGFPK